jgi:sugar phosphate isomerase/epimerase
VWGIKHKKLAVALTCVDWRLHQHKVGLNARLAKWLRVHGVDVVTVPGPDGLLRAERREEWQVAVSQVKLLIAIHNPVTLVVLAHQRCAGHPVPDWDHDSDVAKTAQALKAAAEYAGKVRAAVAIYRSDTSWELKPVLDF